MAAAPEIYYDNQPYSEKADIWLVGITILELVYGGLEVPNRNALEAIIKEIHNKKELPSEINDYYYYYQDDDRSIDAMGEDELMVNKLKCYIQKFVPFWSSVSGTFIEIVMQCLAWNPENRPSADMLLGHKCLQSWPSVKESDFYEAVMNKKNKT